MASGFESTIWNYFLNKIGNEYGVAGLMGNLQAESGLYPDRVQGDIPYSTYSQEYTANVDSGSISEYDFVHNGPNGGGYGLAQWTFYTRKQALYDLYKSGGYSSIGSIELALDYLWYELQNRYPGVLSVLKSATSVRQASDSVLHDFENPADQSETVEQTRNNMGLAFYNQFAGAASFIPRLDSNGIEGSIYYYSQNPFYLAGYGLPNCTCYAWGRFWEISDKSGNGSNKPSLPLGDAGTWFLNVTGYDIGTEPKIGAVICWSYPNAAGHVAIVEQITENGDLITSNSAWGGKYFYTDTVYKSNGYNFGNYVFQGFIYNPHVTFEPVIPDEPEPDPDPDPPDPNVPIVKAKNKKFNFLLFNHQRRMKTWTKNNFKIR